MKSVQQLLCELAESEESVSVRSYSGRGMFGRECVAITGDVRSCQELIAEVIKQATSEVIDQAASLDDDSSDREMESFHHEQSQLMKLIDTLTAYSYDSLGLGVVWYWPKEQWVESEGEEG
jgi:hypothetical protein